MSRLQSRRDLVMKLTSAGVAERGSSADAVVLDPARTYQEILEFGAFFADSACYMLDQETEVRLPADSVTTLTWGAA